MKILKWTNTTSLSSRYGTFSLFLTLVILFSVLPSNFVVSGVKTSRLYPFIILNVILSSTLFTYIFTDGLSIFSPCFSKIYSKQSWISGTEYDPSGNSNLSFHVGVYVFPRLINAKIW